MTTRREPFVTWTLPLIPDIPDSVRTVIFLEVVNCEPHEVLSVERWHNPEFTVRLSKPSSPEVYFGKHKGKTFAEIPSDYLEWMLTVDGSKGWKRNQRQAREELEARA